ncbi:hypothetical protein SCP_0509200 [Sparassis crispa]|uniref:Reverse transcriptase domain-containing protein n=1 Tax=Sparassis crispa TaxID=139825 RepID=A0A401GNR9_9APHY|nr:hypothetical protein SCP_0509200 [Sparassis crispa]GBE83863.1 hypothetical protein SCP_0509200 [Sparassis crispa]
MMNDVLREHLDKFVMVYLDDIIIYSRTAEQHTKHINTVLQTLNSHELVLNQDKCIWGATELLYLGHIISHKGIRPNPEKIKAILTWPRPQTITQLRGFLNISGYYRKFIRGFAKIASGLYTLLHGHPQKGAAIEWSEACERAFDTLKTQLTTPPLLVYPVPWRVFVIDSDASGECIGGISQQPISLLETSNEGGEVEEHDDTASDTRFEFRDCDLRPITYESRRLTPTEQRYSVQEREMLAIDYLLQKWHAYIEGSPIIIRTDHESLKYSLTQKNLGRHLQRFADNIAHFNVKIVYRPGKFQLAADALSRREGEAVPDSEMLGPLYGYPMIDAGLRSCNSSEESIFRDSDEASDDEGPVAPPATPAPPEPADRPAVDSDEESVEEIQ